jgi:hypothetical protein
MIWALKNFNFLGSFSRNSIIQIVWWIVFFPGFFSTDSFGAVQMAKSGELNNSFTASWALYVRIFSFHGDAIALLTLINGLVLVYSITRFGYSIFTNRTAAVSTFLLTLTPLVSGMGVTLWHDILMSAGLILIASFFINIHSRKADAKQLILLELIPGAILSSFRPNGLPTIALFGIIYCFFIFFYQRSQFALILKLQLSMFTLSAMTTILGSILILGVSPINATFAKQWMQFDISCYASTSDGQGFVEVYIPDIGTTQTWKSEAACDFISQANLSTQESAMAEEFISGAWLQLLKTDPLFVIQTHLERNAYLIPLPIFGIPEVPFLHSNIELKDQGIEWKFPGVASEARVFMRAWNGARGLLGWAGFWLFIMLALSRFGNYKTLAPPILMALSLMSILLVVAPIPDGRYVLFVLVIAQLISIGAAVEFLGRKGLFKMNRKYLN